MCRTLITRSTTNITRDNTESTNSMPWGSYLEKHLKPLFGLLRIPNGANGVGGFLHYTEWNWF